MEPVLMVIAGVIIGLVAGFIGGLLGVGGGVVMVPALVLILDTGFQEAKAASLLAIFFLSISGTHTHRRLGNVDRRMGLTIGITGMVGAMIGTLVSTLMDTTILIIIFAITLFASAARFFVKVQEREVEGRWAEPLIGLGGGFIAGLLGVGGGIIMVQGMVYIGVTIHTAVGTSMFAIIFNAASGVLTHAYLGYLQLAVAVPMTLAAVIGVRSGALYTEKVKAPVLKKYFGVALVLVGIYMILRTLGIISLT